MDGSGNRRYQGGSGRAGADVRRRPLSSSSGTSPRSKRPRHRGRPGPGHRIPANAEMMSNSPLSHPDLRSSMNNDDCVLITPRSSRFLFAGSRDRSRTRRGNGSGRMGRERRWHTSPIVLDDDSDDDAVVVDSAPSTPGPSYPRHLRRSTRTVPHPRTPYPRSPQNFVDTTRDNGAGLVRQVGTPQEGRRRQQERRAPQLPPLRRLPPMNILSPLAPVGRQSNLRRRSGSYPRLGGRSSVERQIAEDEQLARRLQEREMGEHRGASHMHDVLDLLNSSSDDDSDDSMSMLGYPFGPRQMSHHGRSPLPSLFPVVSLLDTLHSPLISHLEFFDSDSEDDEYEHLVQLGDALGEVAPQGLTVVQIAQLPTRRVVTSDLASDKRTCQICLEDFKRNNIVRTLPCLHEYHKGCLDKWLKRNSTCPLCRKDALE